MKNLKNKLIIVFVIMGVLLLVAGSMFYFRQFSNTDSSKANQLAKNSTLINEKKTLADKLVITENLANSEKLSNYNSFNINEKKSLIILASFLNEAVNENLAMSSLVEDLKDLKLKPLIIKDSNEYTGTLNIVRTKETLPGTRYIHAQYYEGEDTPSFLQHLSFEFRGGDKAFEMVKQVIQEQLKITSVPTSESDKYISWNEGDKIISIKELDLDSIPKDDTHNSYNLKTDVGTIRVTTELEIH